MADGAAVLEVRDVTVDYYSDGGSVRAVDDVAFDLGPSEFLGIIGESGSGKSTLLFAIAQLLRPPAEVVSGSVRFGGTDLVQLSDQQLRHLRWRDMSVVMQSAMNALNPVMTLEAQMRDACEAHGRTTKKAVRERAASVLQLVGIDPVHLASYPHQLSGGMRQRAMIAMALLFTPQLVIMDEPTSSLDVVAQRSLMVQIKRLQSELGFAVIFVTHDMSLVGGVADRLAVMYAGELVELGPTQGLFTDPRHPYTRGLLDAFPSISETRQVLTGIQGSPPDLGRLGAGCRFAPRCAHARTTCGEIRPELTGTSAWLVRCLRSPEWKNDG